MKKLKLSLLLMSVGVSLSVAGGEINPMSTFVVTDEAKAETTIVPTLIKVDEVKVKEPIKAPIMARAIESNDENRTLSSLYIGGGLTFTKYDSNCYLTSSPTCDGQSTKVGVLLRGGYDYNEYIGAEARAMITGNLTHFGLFAKPMYPISEDFNLYALGGIAKTKTNTDFRNTDVTGLAFGIGLEYDLSDDEEEKELKYDREFDGMANQERGLGLFIDYEKLYYKSNAPTLDALSAGVTYDF